MLKRQQNAGGWVVALATGNLQWCFKYHVIRYDDSQNPNRSIPSDFE